MAFSSNDLAQIEKKGLRPEQVSQQIATFKRGNLAMNITEAATVKNGILALSEEEKDRLQQVFESRKEELDLLKFVPASGAATRMFKAFYTLLEDFKKGDMDLETYLDRQGNTTLTTFFGRMAELPFYEEVKRSIANFNELPEEEQKLQFVEKMLLEEGLGYGNYPKGLVPFHNYPDRTATAFEEHLWEAADYASSQGVARLHFTVPEERQRRFEEKLKEIKAGIEKETGLEYKISYSFQNPKTDTIAVDLANEPFLDQRGNLFFRPGGHGALLENLNHQDADLIFIKNIDNVSVPQFREVTARYKKILAGKLLELQQQTFAYLRLLAEGDPGEEGIQEVIQFVKKDLNSALNTDFEALSSEEKISLLRRLLNRPVRVCGMVKNEGEPGGGPFWVLHKDGNISLQIVESSQIDLDNYQQSKIAQEATHFNPVDIVAGIKDYAGEKLDLFNFVDPDTHFISKKTKDGKELKALEHPGLWNGAMADWITVFVEVPVETFHPVKTVVDLLKPAHQVR